MGGNLKIAPEIQSPLTEAYKLGAVWAKNYFEYQNPKRLSNKHLISIISQKENE